MDFCSCCCCSSSSAAVDLVLLSIRTSRQRSGRARPRLPWTSPSRAPAHLEIDGIFLQNFQGKRRGVLEIWISVMKGGGGGGREEGGRTETRIFCCVLECVLLNSRKVIFWKQICCPMIPRFQIYFQRWNVREMEATSAPNNFTPIYPAFPLPAPPTLVQNE